MNPIGIAFRLQIILQRGELLLLLSMHLAEAFDIVTGPAEELIVSFASKLSSYAAY